MLRKINLKILTALCLMASMTTAVYASDINIKGWEKNGKYDQLYDNTDRDVFKGTLIDIEEITPMDGMTTGIGLLVKDKDDGEKVLVHLGPKDFVEPRIKGLRPGVRLKVYGVLVTIGNDYEYICAKLKAGEERQYKFRLTKDGTPFWSLTPEQLKHEESELKQ
ncbi:hypothetical protein [Maridesulfovibrio zosterae]|uniref:hypothetical protein n=1 Tax=Maridesulfovibrio zosterae TaxID=82171 RepID=UPI000424DA9D|nr:hypothetical protein [Maridesulfovibrio zosterae]